MPALLILLTVVLLVVVWRLTSTKRTSPRTASRRPRFVAPDDDPDFLRDLDRRTRRDDDQP